jgi:hypothetical protein
MEAFREPVSAAQPAPLAPQPGRREAKWRAVKDAVRAYARDPSEIHARSVELAFLSLRREKDRHRAPATGSQSDHERLRGMPKR